VPSSDARSESRQQVSRDAPVTDFGAYLRQARERRELSLRQIAASTKISLMTLEALERGDVARLPGGIFTRGFVRAYAREVGLDPERAVREFLGCYPDQTTDEEPPPVAQQSVELDRERAPAWYGSVLRLLGVVVPLALVVAYFAVGGRLWRSSEPPAPPEPAITTSSVPPPRPSAEGGAARPTAEPATIEPDEVSAPVPTVPDDSRSSPGDLPAARLVVRLAPTEECWVLVRVDGGEADQQLMRAGEAREVRALDLIELTLGNAGAMVYSVNGQPGRKLGELGAVVKDIRMTPDNFRSFVSALQRP